MAKIREDLIGVVSVGGLSLSPGDEIPEGVTVGDHVLAEEAEPAPEHTEAPKRRQRAPKTEE